MKVLYKGVSETETMKAKAAREQRGFRRKCRFESRRWFVFPVLVLLTCCITEFVPEINERKELLVVEGLITDQPETYTVKLSRSLPMGKKSEARPVEGSFVTITDDTGSSFVMRETQAGTYISDSTVFRGLPGRKYTLRIYTTDGLNNYSYESYPMELKPVPPIDTVYYEKKVIREGIDPYPGVDACQIYLDTHDPEKKCKYYRWDFSETWILRLLFPVPNMKCWVYDKSKGINIKSTSAFDEDRITRQPVTYITNNSDRLKMKYSIGVNQYSLNEDEYIYWRKLQNLGYEVGGLFDIIPSSVPSNISCIENPAEEVLGYFSVSARTSKRIFIKDNFEGIIDRYNNCITDTIWGDPDIPGLDTTLWVLIDHPYPVHMRVVTDKKGCYDCTVRGTTVRPQFWIGD